MRSKILIMIAVVVVAIVGIGVGVGLLAGRGSSGHQNTTAQTPANPESQPPTLATTHSAPVSQNPTLDAKPIITNEPNPIIQTSNLSLAATNTTITDTNWEEKIDDIVGSDEPDTNKVKQLFALFPKLPEDGQEEAAQHLSNLVDDDEYAQLGALLKNDKLPEGVLDELLADALNRPNSLKLPALLDVASDPNHAKRDEAKDLLELYLGEDYGTDWNVWGQHMTNWMQQNPD
jgi:hypothetical protein